MKRLKLATFPTLFLALSCSAGATSPDGSKNNGDINVGNGQNTGSDTPGGGGKDDIKTDGPGSIDSAPGNNVDNPESCADAKESQSYIGCDFWPTITANPVWKEFDFAVVVANGQKIEAKLTITGPGGFSAIETVPAGGLKTVILPWVEELKGPEYDLPETTKGRLQTSLSMKGGAYHLVSSIPVASWQFNPLQYRRDKADCGTRIQAALASTPKATECRAASNDAALLLPSTAMTGNYRVGGYSGAKGGDNWGSTPGAFSITATQDGTKVDIQLPPHCEAKNWNTNNGCLLAGGLVPAGVKNEVLSLELDAGDVVELVGAYGPVDEGIAHADLSGSVVHANHPVQVIAFSPILNIPEGAGNADHVEETVLPAEVIGKKYIVPPPTAFGGEPQGHIVRIYGNVDGTTLSYPNGKPNGAPDTINAGEVVELPPRKMGNFCSTSAADCSITESFTVEGSEPFAVGSFLLGGQLQVPNYTGESYGQPGDPAASMMVTPQQFRKSYTFLAPADFTENYADILVPEGATAILDGTPLPAGTAIGTSGWSIVRALLSGDKGGIHSLSTEDERGLGLQVMGFGAATSYYYPGGLNLKHISDPPVIEVIR